MIDLLSSSNEYSIWADADVQRVYQLVRGEELPLLFDEKILGIISDFSIDMDYEEDCGYRGLTLKAKKYPEVLKLPTVGVSIGYIIDPRYLGMQEVTEFLVFKHIDMVGNA